MKLTKRLLVGLLLVFAISLTACGANSSGEEIAVGSPAPHFSLTDSEGDTVSLAEFKGQPVLLFFHMAGG